MANRKPIRWAVPLGGESYMGLAQYFLTHEENMRQAFSQPSRRARRTLPDGTTIDYIMNDVVDFIMISPPQMQRAVGKKMTWDKLPPFEEGTTSTIDLSQMTEDPDVEDGYYCTVSVINGTDENGNSLSAEFSVKAGTDDDGDEYSGWSIEQGIRQGDGTYKVDGKSATLLLGADVEGGCDIIVRDGKAELSKKVTSRQTVEDYYFLDVISGKYISYADLIAGNYTNLIDADNIKFDNDQSDSLPVYSTWCRYDSSYEDYPYFYRNQRVERFESPPVSYAINGIVDYRTWSDEGHSMGGVQFGSNSSNLIVCEFDYVGGHYPIPWITPSNLTCSVVILQDVFDAITVNDGELFYINMDSSEPSVGSGNSRAHTFYRSADDYLCKYSAPDKQVAYIFMKKDEAKISQRIDFSGSDIYLASSGDIAVYSGTRLR